MRVYRKKKLVLIFRVPAASDLQVLQDILDKDFPAWKDNIKAQAKKYLNKELLKEATANATKAVLPIVKNPIKEVGKQISILLTCIHTLETHKGLKRCNSHMYALTDAREYSIVQVPYLESDHLHSVGLPAYVLELFLEESPVILSSFR